jgi:hypothetical protein
LIFRSRVEDLLPQDAQLQFRQPVAEAAVDAEAKRHVLARAGAVDDKAVRVLDRLLVAVCRDVPDHDLVAHLDPFGADFRILERGAPHVDHRALPADDLRHQARDERAFSRNLRNSSGCWLNPQTTPDELRVVSFPPTRNRINMPMR